MSISSQGKKGGGNVADRTSFVGARIPREVKLMVKYLKKCDKETFRKLLKTAVSSFEGASIEEDVFDSLATKIPLEIIHSIYAGIYTILKCALRLTHTSLKSEVFKEDLTELKLPQEYITDLASAVYGSKRTSLDEALVKNGSHLPNLNKLKWRTDVTISSSNLNRVLEPTILMEMSLSDGSVKEFEVPVSKFHELRYNVSYLLKEMEEMEKRSILKIQD
ncbi:COMM domain-containing protein 5-like [Anneissia japonica]|uniref:COMM domain-containing protein 5-like n=1 Tax=Anneissia japonica TaxID=1529436 RepID=UPI001425AF14|nr:COMM domain-containing protein 5-like [Anneissia japonica]